MQEAPLVVALGALFLAGAASAGAADAPELEDATGDCAFVAGNEYVDIVSAWVSDETEDAFTVNIGVAKWSEQAGVGAGFTIQFLHQDVQFGVTALRTHEGWEFGNALYEGGRISGYNESTGSFTPGTPAVISIAFEKANFPHADAMDHTLGSFTGYSGDLKGAFPLFLLPANPPVPPETIIAPCDQATGTGEYTFETGQHAHMAAGANQTTQQDAAKDLDASSTDSGAAAPSDVATPEAETPAIGAFGAVAALGVAVALARRR
ncbi:MAG TPA: hypothetical protein VI997_06320 [Candidatus Thermoplasmatota archaeon]|nr:hypothetical protein [Candidatus Thermoplasmatota archaeon]